jgi:hypothetical protein
LGGQNKIFDMETSRPQGWLGAALVAGVAYVLIGRLFALPAEHVQMWRLAAWVASAVVYATHIGYEKFGLGSPSRSTALHAALAVAMGAFLLAVAGMLHSLASASETSRLWLLALVVWPAVTAVPAFLLAIVAAMALGRFQRSN